MYRLNCQITEEAEAILKEKAKRYGTSLGTVVTMLAMETKKESEILAMTKLFDQFAKGGSGE